MWKTRNYLSQKIFREINSLVTSLVKMLVSRNFCQKSVREKLRKFSFTHFWQKFRESILLKRWFHEIFFRWEKISRFSTLWCAHCAIESQNLREMNKLKVCNFHKNKNSLGWNILLEIHSLLSHFSFQQVERAKFIHYYAVVVYLCMREKVDVT